MILQDQMLGGVYWQQFSRSIIAMFHAVLAAIIGKKTVSKLTDVVDRLKKTYSEEEALRTVILPEIERLPADRRFNVPVARLRPLVDVQNFTDIYGLVREYRRSDPIPAKVSARHNVYQEIVMDPGSGATSVPINWDHAGELRRAFLGALEEKKISCSDFDVVVDVPYGKTRPHQVFVRMSEGNEIAIENISHLKPTLFEDPALHLAPVRVYMAPQLVHQVGSRMSSIVTSAEERFYARPTDIIEGSRPAESIPVKATPRGH